MILKLRGKSPAGLSCVSKQTIIGRFKNRSLRIIVHRNDHLSVLDAGCMLNSAGDAETDVKKIADYICESNDNDGIANTLDKFVLKQ